MDAAPYMPRRFKVDQTGLYQLEDTLNKRVEEGWLLVSQDAFTSESGLRFVLTWYKPPEGQSVPLGFKVL